MKRFVVSSVAVIAFGCLTFAPAAYAQETPPPTNPPTAPAPPETPTPEQEKKPRRRLVIGPTIGYYFPSSARARDAFGNNFQNFGLGVGRIRPVSENGAISFDFSVVNGRNSGSRAFVIPLGVSYIRGFIPSSRVKPYAGVSLNLFITDLRSDRYDIDSGIRTASGGSLFVGTTFSERLNLQARYYGLTPIRGINLSGWNLSAGYRF
jgi:hypothetical protein